YRGGGPAMNDLLSGQVDLFFEVISNVAQHVNSKKVTALMSTGEKRSPLLPDVPTAAELGYGKMRLNVWTGLAAPARTPAAVIEMLNAEANKALELPDTKAFLERTGNLAVGGSASDMANIIKSDVSTYRRIITDNNIVVN